MLSILVPSIILRCHKSSRDNFSAAVMLDALCLCNAIFNKHEPIFSTQLLRNRFNNAIAMMIYADDN